jgi:hypothetical protein
MAEPTQYTVSHRELIELIIKNAGIRDGRWVLGMTFGFSPGMFGPTPDQMNPGVVVAVNQVSIHRESPDGSAPESVVVDAALVNPGGKREAPRKRPKG